MRPSVASAWKAFNQPFEGLLSCMYLDMHEPPLVTTGMGNLIDPIGLALDLPWRLKADERLASKIDVDAEWRAVKAATWLAKAGAAAAERFTRLRLDPVDIDKLIAARLRDNEAELVRLFPAFEDWPADAQMAALSMAWAMGVGKMRVQFRRFQAACVRLDFAGAAAECEMNGVGVAGRNAANARLFHAAAETMSRGGDRDALTFGGPTWPST